MARLRCVVRGPAALLRRFTHSAVLIIFVVLTGFASASYGQSSPDSAAPTQQSAQTADSTGTVIRSKDWALDQDIDVAFQAMKRNPRYQFELIDPDPPRPRPQWAESLAAFFAAIQPVIAFIFYLVLGAFVVIVLLFIGREVVRIRWGRDKSIADDTAAASPVYTPDAATARILLDDVDKLAAEGKFAEAVHTLLFRSIQDIERQHPSAVRRSLTSREIGTLPILGSDARVIFRMIAHRVERSFFGAKPLGREDFDVCRAAYKDFAVGHSRSGAST